MAPRERSAEPHLQPVSDGDMMIYRWPWDGVEASERYAFCTILGRRGHGSASGAIWLASPRALKLGRRKAFEYPLSGLYQHRT